MNLSQADTKAFGFFLTEAVHQQTFFPDARCQARKVAIAGNQAEAIEATGVEQIHRVDDHGAIGRVLPTVAELLDGLDG